MPTYAAIRLTRETIMSALSNLEGAPGGKERLIWAMLRHQYRADMPLYYIGGNYLRLQHLDYSRQLLTQTELDLLFTYKEQRKIPGRPDPYINWFPVRLKENYEEALGMIA